MAQSGQTYKTHTRWFPPFHFFVMPVLLINVFVSGWLLYQESVAPWPLGVDRGHGAGDDRTDRAHHGCRVQDRVIRLEMRLRMRELLPADLQARIWRGHARAVCRSSLRERCGTARPRPEGVVRRAEDVAGNQATGRAVAGRLPACLIGA